MSSVMSSVVGLLIFWIICVGVPVALVAAISVVLRRAGHVGGPSWLLYLACGLFMVSWFLPSPLIEGRDTSFTTHFVGGGMFAGVLWCYLKLSLGWRGRWPVEAFSVFALVSALGCINELFELGIVEIGLSRLTLDDTNWDILANSLGALVVYIAYLLVDLRGNHRKSWPG